VKITLHGPGHKKELFFTFLLIVSFRHSYNSSPELIFLHKYLDSPELKIQNIRLLINLINNLKLHKIIYEKLFKRGIL